MKLLGLIPAQCLQYVYSHLIIIYDYLFTYVLIILKRTPNAYERTELSAASSDFVLRPRNLL